MIDKNTTLAELASEHPAAASALAYHGLEADERTIAEAAGVLGFCGCELAEGLGLAVAGLDVWGMAPGELIDNILSTHHAWLRESLPAGDDLLAEARSAGSNPAALDDLIHVYQGLVQELTSHMIKEEQILFPMIRQLADEGRITCGCGHLDGPVAQMEHEHECAKAALRQFKALRPGLAERAGLDPALAGGVDAFLATLHGDLVTHIYKENRVLFPKAFALAAQPA